jgi:2-amino-4-hydroxy-6-hydroxymethyldihydropteridine diphosphokinase
MGDRMANLTRAAVALDAHQLVTVVASSRVIETPPLGPPQDHYFNAVLALDTSLAPHELLELCWRIEAAGKRQRLVRWGPRTIDIDLLDVGGAVLDCERLRLPHPEIGARQFVIVPLADVAPDWRHPTTGDTINELAKRAAGETQAQPTVVAEADAWCPPTDANPNGSNP